MNNATARSGDPLAIRYLDGSTTASPYRIARVEERRAALHVLERQSVPTGRLLAALSTALDLTEGQLAGHALRTCFLATRLADRMGLASADREALFFAAFLPRAVSGSTAASWRAGSARSARRPRRLRRPRQGARPVAKPSPRSGRRSPDRPGPQSLRRRRTGYWPSPAPADHGLARAAEPCGSVGAGPTGSPRRARPG